VLERRRALNIESLMFVTDNLTMLEVRLSVESDLGRFLQELTRSLTIETKSRISTNC